MNYQHHPNGTGGSTKPGASSGVVQTLAEARARRDASIQRRLLSLAEVEAVTRRKKSSIYAGMAQDPPTFPRCVRLPGGRNVAWLSTDIDAWVDKVLKDSGHAAFGGEGQGT